MKIEVLNIDGLFDYSTTPYIADYSFLENVELDFFRLSVNVKGSVEIKIYTSIDGTNYVLHSTHSVSDGMYDSALFHFYSRYIRVEISGSGSYIYVALLFFSELEVASAGGGGAEPLKQIEYDIYLSIPIYYDIALDTGYYFLPANNQVIALLSKHTVSNQLNLMIQYKGDGSIKAQGGFTQNLSSPTPTLLSIALPNDTNYIIIEATTDLYIYAIKVFYQV